LPNGEIHDFTFDKRSPKKGLFVAVRYYGIYYGTVETNGTVSSTFVKITDTNLTAKIPSGAGQHHNYSRLEFDPDSSDILYLARHWPAGGVFRIRLGFNASTGQRLAVSSSDFIKSVDEVITARVDALGSERSPRDSTAASDVINLLITKEHVFAGVTCGDTIDVGGINYCGGLVQWAKTAQSENYFWRIGGPSSIGVTSKTIAIGGVAQDPFYPDTIFAVTHRFTLKASRDADQLYRGEENYKPMHIWRSVNGGATFNKLEYWQSEHRFPEAVTMAFFPDSPDSMIMPTHGNGIWIAARYTGPPYIVPPPKAVADTSQGNQNLPKRFALHANYPNPFNPTTVIKYDLPKAAHVTLTIYDVLGRKVRTLLDKDMLAGYQSIVWEGKDDRDVPVASGIYLYRIQAAAFIKVKKMMLLR